MVEESADGATRKENFNKLKNLFEKSDYEGDLKDESKKLDSNSLSSRSSHKKRKSSKKKDADDKTSSKSSSSSSRKKKEVDSNNIEAILGKSVGNLELINSPKSSRKKNKGDDMNNSVLGKSSGNLPLFEDDEQERRDSLLKKKSKTLKKDKSDRSLNKALKKEKSEKSLKKERSERSLRGTPKSVSRKKKVKSPKSAPVTKKLLGKDDVLAQLDAPDILDDDAGKKEKEKKKRSAVLKKEKSESNITRTPRSGRKKSPTRQSDAVLGRSPKLEKSPKKKSPKSKKKKMGDDQDNLAKFEMLLGKAHSVPEDGIEEEEEEEEIIEEEVIEEKPKERDSARMKNNLAKFEQMFSTSNHDDDEEEVIIEEEVVEEENPKKSKDKAVMKNNLAKFEQMIGKSNDDDDDEEEEEEGGGEEEIIEEEVVVKEEKPKPKNGSQMKNSLAKFEQMLRQKDEEIIEEEVIEDRPKEVEKARKQNNLAKFEQMFGKKGEEILEEEVEVEEKATSPQKGTSQIRDQLKQSNAKFEEALKLHNDSFDEESIYEEELSEDDGDTNKRPISKTARRVSSSLSFDSDDEDLIDSIQTSFQTLHKSRKAAMLQMVTAVPKQVSTTILTTKEEEDDDEYEDQVIEKWFRRDSLPDDLETACRELIPIVYKGEDVNADTMMRRTPLPELYKYLRQHLDYKQMKQKSNLNKFEKLFENAMNDSFGNLNYQEDAVVIDDDLEKLSSHAIRKSGRASARNERRKKKESTGGNHDKFEELLRRAHSGSGDASDSDSRDSFGEEVYEEVVVEKAPSSTNDRKMNNLAMFEQMVGGYEDEEI